MGFEATGNTFLNCLGVIHKLCNANQEGFFHAIKQWLQAKAKAKGVAHKRRGQLAKMAVRIIESRQGMLEVLFIPTIP